MKRSFVIAVDFDGTIADHRYPDVGAEVPGAISALKELIAHGARLILFTMRSDLIGPGVGPEGCRADHPYLTAALDWCRARGVEFWAVNENPNQRSWTSSPKPMADVYIDDAAVGCPLRDHPRAGSRPCVDWDRVMEILRPKLTEAR